MTREFVKEFLSILTSNYKNLVSIKVVRRSDGIPMLELAVLKIKMMVHVIFINSLMNRFLAGKIQHLEPDKINQIFQQEFSDAWYSYYSGLSKTHNYSFNLFWERLLKHNQIPENHAQNYKNAKIQVSVFWQVLNQLYPLGEANSVEYYRIGPDEYEDNLPIMNCSNYLLDKVLNLIASEQYIPVSCDWKDSDEPAVFEMKLLGSENLSKKNTQPFDKKIMRYEDKTLGDVWTDYSLMHTIQKEVFAKDLFLHKVEHELAYHVSIFSLTQERIIEGLCRKEDFQGHVWENKNLTPDEFQDLVNLQEEFKRITEINQSQQRTIETLSSSIQSISTVNADQAHTIGKFVERDLNSAKVYSNNKTERAREIVGELLKETPIIIPNMNQKQEFPDCRWILSCTKTEKNRIVPSIEKAIRIWMEACQTQELGFWASSVLINGLYLLMDSELIKGKDADPNIKRKIDNAFSRSCFYKSERELFEDIITKISKQ
jgi:hypothetical protein